LSAEERLYKQLEGIVSSIIKALEGLEKEFSEYIEITNKRLVALEGKMKKMESLADVSGKGLVEAIDTSTNSDAVKELAHLTQQTTSEIKPAIIKDHSLEDERIITESIVKDETTKTMPEKPVFEIPHVPTPPSEQISIKEEPIVEKPTGEEVVPQPPKTEKIDELTKESKKDDKEELMDALKIIDSL